MAKFLKFNINESIKSLLILMAVCLGSAAAAAVMNFSNASAIVFIRSVFSILSVISGVGMITYSFVYSWLNFYNTEYSDKAYLIRTLPVKRTVIFDSVLITSILYLLVSFGVFIFSVYLCMPENVRQSVAQLIKELGNNKSILLLIVSGAFLQMLFGVQCGFCGMLFGMKQKNSRIGWSILFGILIYYISELLIVGTIFLVFLATGNNFFESEVIALEQGKQLLTALVSTYILLNGLFYLFERKLLSKGVDVDL